MSDELGVDASDGSAPFVITEPLGQPVIDSAETARRLAEREEWRRGGGRARSPTASPRPVPRSGRRTGADPAGRGAPGPGVRPRGPGRGRVLAWCCRVRPRAGLGVGAADRFAVSSFVGLLVVEDHRDRAAAALAAARREFTDPHDKALIAAGHRSALAVTGLRPRLPLYGEELDISRLRRKLWLAGILARRRELEDAAASLRAATAGLPGAATRPAPWPPRSPRPTALYQAADTRCSSTRATWPTWPGCAAPCTTSDRPSHGRGRRPSGRAGPRRAGHSRPAARRGHRLNRPAGR